MRVAATGDVVIVNNGETVWPAATVTEGGTVTPGSLLDRFTTTPPAEAGLLSVTLLDVVGRPPTTELGDSVTEAGTIGFTVRLAVLVPPLQAAEIVTMLVAATGDVVIVNDGETVWNARTVTEGGTVTLGSLLDRLTGVSTGAGPLRVTLLAVVAIPPTTDAGDSVTETGVNGFTTRVAPVFAPA